VSGEIALDLLAVRDVGILLSLALLYAAVLLGLKLTQDHKARR
jgi:hypothetical protein